MAGFGCPPRPKPAGRRQDPFPLDLSPEVLGELDDAELEDSIEALDLLCRSSGVEIARATCREELVSASKRYIEITSGQERMMQQG
ncbi:MAG: hypothetical protein ACK5ZS_00170 [bacterium]|jgi:hypothetical protein